MADAGSDDVLLLHRRNRALARLSSAADTAVATTSNPNPNPCNNNVESDTDTESEDEPTEDVEENSDGGDCLEKLEDSLMNEMNNTLEIDKKEDCSLDEVKRRQEIEEKLQILNAKKHSLVQVLKQILNAEEELKRQSTMPGMAIYPPIALQVDISHDSGSNMPRMISGGNVSGDVEGGETGDVDHNVLLRHLLCTSSTSPSSDSQQMRPAL